MSVAAAALLGVMDLSGVFCVADSGALQDVILWNSVGMRALAARFSSALLQRSKLAAKTELMLIANVVSCHQRDCRTVTCQFQKRTQIKSNSNNGAPCRGKTGSARQ